MCLHYLHLSFSAGRRSGKPWAYTEHTQSLKLPTQADPHHGSPAPQHCLNKGKLRNVPVEVACRAVWHLFYLYRLVGFNYFLGGKKRGKKLMFSAGGKSEILVRRKKGRDFNMGISTLQSLLMSCIIYI